MAFRWRSPPLVIGHRGSPREAPENTLASFLAAFRAGARAVELDARLTRDGVVVVHHDAGWGRTVPGEGLVEETLAADVARLDAGIRFSPAFAGEPVPTLVQVLEALPEDALLDVELKADGGNAHLLPEAVLEAVRGAGALDRVLVTSFDPGLADDYARRSGRPAGYLLPFPPEPVDLEAWPRLEFLALAEDAVEEACLAEAAARGRRVLAWTVNAEREAERLAALGVEGIITDRPEAFLRWAALRAPGPSGASGP